ncbi:MAG: ABC transporter permease subunit [Actinobacteria bacterium]|nr:ABC transporter permease subunit [Actinomycetota bacterium]
MTPRLIRWSIWALLAVPAVVLVLGLLGTLATPAGVQALGSVLNTQSGLIGSTLAYCLATAIAGTGLGWLLAHVLAMYRTPGRRVLHALCLAPLVLPSFTFAMALIVLFGHSGLVTGRLAPGFEVYGFGGLVVAGTMARFPLAYLNLSWAYRRLDTALLEAAGELGASPGRVTRRLVVPRLGPPLLSSFLLLFGDAMADVAIPLVIGGGYPTLATRMYEAIASEGDLTAATAYALLLTVPAVVLWLLASRLGREQSNPIGTAAPRPARAPAVAGRLLQVLAWASAGLVLALLLAVLAGALSDPDGGLSTAQVWSLLHGPDTRPFAMSLVLALVAAPLAMALAFALTRAASDELGRLRRARRTLQALAALPPTVLGLGAFLALSATGTWLRDAGLEPRIVPWLAIGAILAVHLVRFTPRVALPALRSADALVPLLRDQAVLLGARPRDLTRSLVWPGVRTEIAGGGLATFADTLTAVSSVILLTNAQVPLLPVRMLADIDAGRLPAASAATLVLSGAVLIVTGVHRLWRSDLVRRRLTTVVAR